MIQLVVFDLSLLTAATDPYVADPLAYQQEIGAKFGEYRTTLENINTNLKKNPSIAKFLLYVPVTQALLDCLSNFFKANSHLRRIQTIIMAFLSGNDQRPRFIVLRDDTTFNYEINGASENILLKTLLAEKLCDAWVSILGDCAFAIGSPTSSDITDPIGAVRIISDRNSLPESLSISSGKASKDIPILVKPDDKMLQDIIRHMLWIDTRLPFGPIGYCPPDRWKMGKRPSRYRWCDRLGGIWRWDPNKGHWDVSVSGDSVSKWVKYIKRCTGRDISTNIGLITHINVDVDGRITHGIGKE